MPCLSCSGCEPAADSGRPGDAGLAADGGAVERWQPAPGASWQYQLSGKLDLSVDAEVFDVDLYETSDADIASLHERGRKLVCYFDTAYEPGRPESKALEPYRGNPMDGWPGQYWLDIRRPEVLRVMQARIELAQSKHCDAVEADDVDSRSNDPGFPISARDQQGFIAALSDAAHSRGLAFGLKNDLDEVPQLVDHADFAINEQCYQYDECDALALFLKATKPVFNVEYTEGDLSAKGSAICARAKRDEISSIIKHIEVGPERFGCP